MQTQILNPKQVQLLDLISKSGGLTPFELGGGTAVALYLGHRKSIDFDFFTQQKFNPNELRLLFDQRKLHFKPIREATQTLIGTINDVFVSFFQFNYPQIAPTQQSPWGFSLLSLEDIIGMKIEAISGRGSRKDFVDLYWICKKKYSLEQCFEFYKKKFTQTEFDPYHRLRSLTYFDDADAEPMPEVIENIEWDAVKTFFQNETKKVWGHPLK